MSLMTQFFCAWQIMKIYEDCVLWVISLVVGQRLYEGGLEGVLPASFPSLPKLIKYWRRLLQLNPLWWLSLHRWEPFLILNLIPGQMHEATRKRWTKSGGQWEHSFVFAKVRYLISVSKPLPHQHSLFRRRSGWGRRGHLWTNGKDISCSNTFLVLSPKARFDNQSTLKLHQDSKHMIPLVMKLILSLLFKRSIPDCRILSNPLALDWEARADKGGIPVWH